MSTKIKYIEHPVTLDLSNPYQNTNLYLELVKYTQDSVAKGIIFHSHNRDYKYRVRGTAREFDISVVPSDIDNSPYKAIICQLFQSNKYISAKLRIYFTSEDYYEVARRVILSNPNCIPELKARILESSSDYLNQVQLVLSPTFSTYENLFLN